MKTLFLFNPHSIVDIITNSSSELFIFKGGEQKEVEKMIKSVYPDYKQEYTELINIMDLSAEDLDGFMYNHCHARVYPAARKDYPLIGDYTFDELYEPKYNDGRLAHNGEVQYQLRDNFPPKPKVKKFDDFKNMDLDPFQEENWTDDEDEEYFGDPRWRPRYFVKESNKMEVINRICPKHNWYFLYSSDENPNWDYQEKLMKIGGRRYHLG